MADHDDGGWSSDDETCAIDFGGVDDLSDGEDTAYGFTDITFNDDLTLITIRLPLWYRPPIDPGNGVWGDPIDASLVATVDLETEDVTIGIFSVEGRTIGSLETEPTGLLFPKVAIRPAGMGVYDEVTWVPSTEVGLWADLDALDIDWVLLPSGTPFRSELVVSDYGGNEAIHVVVAEVP